MGLVHSLVVEFLKGFHKVRTRSKKDLGQPVSCRVGAPASLAGSDRQTILYQNQHFMEKTLVALSL